jgi:hypothetical protein
MANLIGTSVARNYQRAIMTDTGTRKLSYFVVSLSGVHTNFWAPGSLYAKAILGIQEIAEIYSVGYPANDSFTVTVAYDTAIGCVDPWPAGFAWGNNSTTTGRSSAVSRQGVNTYLQDAINAATDGECNVWNAVFEGGGLTYNC